MNFSHNKLLKIEENGHTLNFYSIAFSRLCEQIFLTIMASINSFMLSGYSGEAVAASSFSAQIINLATVLLNMITTGTVIRLSISLGRQDNRAGRISSTAFYTVLIAGLIVAVSIIAFSEKILNIMNVEPYMLDMTISYLRIVAAFLPVKILMSLFNNLLICNGYAVCSLAVGILCNLTNAGLCYVVLYGSVIPSVDKVTAVACANGIASLAGLLLSVIFYFYNKCPFGFKFCKNTLGSIFRVGVPGGMNGFSYTLAQTITTSFIATFGVLVFNTKIYVANIVVFAYCISASIGHAGAIFTGRYRGKKDFNSINILYKRNIKLGIFCNTIISLLLFTFHKPIIGLFTSNAAAIKLAGQIMLIDVVVEAVRAINNVSDQSLNANGDVKTTLTASVTACWLCSVLISYVFGIKLNMGLPGIWLAFLMDEILKATIYLIRWKSGKWKYLED